MVIQTAVQIGQALVVQGSVTMQSVNGVGQVVKPNSPIHLDDRIDTGGDGAVSILLADSENTQLDIGNMSRIIIDDDVAGSILPELGDVAVEAGLVGDLLQNWESFEPLAPLETIAPEEAMDSDADEMAGGDSIPGLDGSTETVAASDEAGDDGFGGIDDDLDMSNLIPPPDDAS